MVWVNSSNDSDFRSVLSLFLVEETLINRTRIPFGGVKQSGIGRELGEAGLASYYAEKAVHVNMS
jgi:aldehyde dehydrogenase (NAD+)